MKKNNNKEDRQARAYGTYDKRRLKEAGRRQKEKGDFEMAAILGLLYQTPIRLRDILLLRKENLTGRELHCAMSRFQGQIYLDMNHRPYKISRQLCRLLLSLNPGKGLFFQEDYPHYQNRLMHILRDSGLPRICELRLAFLSKERQYHYKN